MLTVSTEFQKGHPKHGLQTNFALNILGVLGKEGYPEFTRRKIHTIRGNYELWKERIDKVNAGLAYISLRNWEGKPYNSKQNEFAALYQNQVGIQKIEFDKFFGIFIDDVDSDIKPQQLADNDGLSYENFKAWFEPIKINNPYAIIHFTDFRY